MHACYFRFSCGGGESNQPHSTIVEPSRFSANEIIIPIVQMQISIKNIQNNNKIFIHVTKKDENEVITQFKIIATAFIENEGKLFEEVKQFEESERLPEEWTVKGIIRAKLIACDEVVG